MTKAKGQAISEPPERQPSGGIVRESRAATRRPRLTQNARSLSDALAFVAFEGIDKESQRRRPSSVYRGVTRHRRTGRWEAHIRVKMPEAPRGRQIYLGGFEKEDLAAEAYDAAMLCYRGPSAEINFNRKLYSDLVPHLHALGDFQDVVRCIRGAAPKGSPAAKLATAAQLAAAAHATARHRVEDGEASLNYPGQDALGVISPITVPATGAAPGVSGPQATHNPQVRPWEAPASAPLRGDAIDSAGLGSGALGCLGLVAASPDDPTPAGAAPPAVDRPHDATPCGVISAEGIRLLAEAGGFGVFAVPHDDDAGGLARAEPCLPDAPQAGAGPCTLASLMGMEFSGH